MEQRPLDDILLDPDSSADDALDEGLRETFPASDPIAVGLAYCRRSGTRIAGVSPKGETTWPFP
jgi:hypothetical protein